MKTKAIGLVGGTVFGFTLAWAQLTDPRVIRDMLLLKEAHVFLIMGSAVVIAAVGVRLLTMVGTRTIVTHERIGWTIEHPRRRHVAGSILFAVGWTMAGTCPGPVAAMIGQGGFAGLPVATGIFAGVLLQRAFMRTPKLESSTQAAEVAAL